MDTFNGDQHIQISSVSLIIFIDILENKWLAFGLFLDLWKAYDSLNHEYFKYKWHTWNWEIPFLSNRGQKVIITKNTIIYQSEKEMITVGIPQDSVIGLVLFIIYLNHDFGNMTNRDQFITDYIDHSNILIGANLFLELTQLRQ